VFVTSVVLLIETEEGLTDVKLGGLNRLFNIFGLYLELIIGSMHAYTCTIIVTLLLVAIGASFDSLFVFVFLAATLLFTTGDDLTLSTCTRYLSISYCSPNSIALP
jgi:hypothetical protein